MKLYEVIIRFLDPAQAVVSVVAESEEMARSRIIETLKDQMQALEIVSVKLAVDAPDVEVPPTISGQTIN